MRPEIFFKNESGIVAVTSDAGVDFTPQDFDAPLTSAQRAYLHKATGIDIPQVFWRKQVHGDEILEARALSKGCPEADAYITNQKNLAVAIRTADCVPVFIFDPKNRAIGIAHAGWKGSYLEIGIKTVKMMERNYNSSPPDLKAVLGPSIRDCCYQVGREFLDYFPGHVQKREGFLYADITGANRDQLLKAGLRPGNIFDSRLCTCCNDNYFSFRRDGDKAGRMISLMVLQ